MKTNSIDLINKHNFPLNIKNILLLEEIFFYIKEEKKIKNYSVELNIVNDVEMKKVNKQYRNIDKTTDVLSFSFLGEVEVEQLGIIYISYHEISKFSTKGFTYNLSFLFIHGIFHLLGYDHSEEMSEEEKKIERIFLSNF